MQAVTISQSLINESFGLKRLLTLTEEFVMDKITQSVSYASELVKGASNFNKETLHTDQCYTLCMLYGLIKQDVALCSILGMSTEFFEPIAVSQISPWLRDCFDFPANDVYSALKYAAMLKEQQVSIPSSALKVLVQLAKDRQVVVATEDQAIAELMESMTLNLSPAVVEIQKGLEDAVVANNPEALEKAIKDGADPNYVLADGQTYLHIAISKNNIAAATALIANKARVDGENSEGKTPLCCAAKSRNVEAIELLLANQAKVNYLNAGGHTAIHIAARENFQDIVELLITKGSADVNLPDSNGCSPLHWAAAAGHVEMVRFLQRNNACVNNSSKNGWTPLHAAAEYNHVEVVELLTNSSTDLNATGEGGFTPLHLAADNGHIEAVRLLVKKGADHRCKSNDTTTPAEMARDSGHKAVFRFLEDLSQ